VLLVCWHRLFRPLSGLIHSAERDERVDWDVPVKLERPLASADVGTHARETAADTGGMKERRVLTVGRWRGLAAILVTTVALSSAGCGEDVSAQVSKAYGWDVGECKKQDDLTETMKNLQDGDYAVYSCANGGVLAVVYDDGRVEGTGGGYYQP
jgi:hypothetical protein